MAAAGERDIFVFASKGGSVQHPAWYYSLFANPDVKVEIDTRTFDAAAKEITGPERDWIYAQQVVEAPRFGDYQRVRRGGAFPEWN